jgi:hypothetical protein
VDHRSKRERDGTARRETRTEAGGGIKQAYLGALCMYKLFAPEQTTWAKINVDVTRSPCLRTIIGGIERFHRVRSQHVAGSTVDVEVVGAMTRKDMKEMTYLAPHIMTTMS